MSTHPSHASTRSSTSQGTLHVTVQPNPFTPGDGYTITVTGGVPPYSYKIAPTPPNPQGVTITPNGSTCHVDCPAGTPSGTPVKVVVTDSSTPPNKQPAVAVTA